MVVDVAAANVAACEAAEDALNGVYAACGVPPTVDLNCPAYAVTNDLDCTARYSGVADSAVCHRDGTVDWDYGPSCTIVGEGVAAANVAACEQAEDDLITAYVECGHTDLLDFNCDTYATVNDQDCTDYFEGVGLTATCDVGSAVVSFDYGYACHDPELVSDPTYAALNHEACLAAQQAVDEAGAACDSNTSISFACETWVTAGYEDCTIMFQEIAATATCVGGNVTYDIQNGCFPIEEFVGDFGDGGVIDDFGDGGVIGGGGESDGGVIGDGGTYLVVESAEVFPSVVFEGEDARVVAIVHSSSAVSAVSYKWTYEDFNGSPVGGSVTVGPSATVTPLGGDEYFVDVPHVFNPYQPSGVYLMSDLTLRNEQAVVTVALTTPAAVTLENSFVATPPVIQSVTLDDTSVPAGGSTSLRVIATSTSPLLDWYSYNSTNPEDIWIQYPTSFTALGADQHEVVFPVTVDADTVPGACGITLLSVYNQAWLRSDPYEVLVPLTVTVTAPGG